MVDATVAVFIFQIVALMISYFYFIPFLPGIWIVWVLYYIAGYRIYGRTLGQAFFNAGITVKKSWVPLSLRIIIREAFTTIPGMAFWIIGWDGMNVSRSLIMFLICLILLCLRRKLFGIKVCRWESASGNGVSDRYLRPGWVYFFLICAGVVARLVNTVITTNDAIYSDSFLYASPRPTANSVAKYVDFLQDNRRDINDYVMELFDKYDHVILCERAHQEMTQYDMIYNLVTDRRFVDKVGVVFTEIGCAESRAAYEALTDSVLPVDTIVDKELASFLTENGTVHLLWPNTNWFDFLKRMYYFNHGREKKVRILFSDRNWIDRSMLYARDSIMADNITSTILSDSLRKSLTIMNYRHAYINNPGDCGYYVAREFPGKVANVLINTYTVDFMLLMANHEIFKPLQHGRWDVAFEQIGDSAFAFSLDGSPFGKDRFDHFVLPWSNVSSKRYQEMFNGIIYYKALTDQYMSLGYNNLFDPENEQKLLAREQAMPGYKLSYWDFLRNGPYVTTGIEFYYDVCRLENYAFIGIVLLSLLLDCVLSAFTIAKI